MIALADKAKRRFTDIKTVWTCQTNLEHPEGENTNGSHRLSDDTGNRVWTVNPGDDVIGDVQCVSRASVGAVALLRVSNPLSSTSISTPVKR